MASTTGRQGTLHQYTSRLVAFEHASKDSTELSLPRNLLIFVGGLSDGLLTVKYTTTLANSLPPTWSLAQPLLSSSYSGWGISNLQKDVLELSQCVSYSRENGKTGKIVLMGHSTGCQDVMEYLVGQGAAGRSRIDGGILQAGVSDREAFAAMSENFDETVEKVKKIVDEGKGDEILSLDMSRDFCGETPIHANRFLSLTTKGGDDDYFSTDLEDEVLEKSFGRLPSGTAYTILFSGSDEYVGKDVDRPALVNRWLGFARKSGAKVDEESSGVVEGATHNLNGDPEEVVQDLITRVVGFLKRME